MLTIGSELVPEKVKAARRNLAEAGLEPWAEIREGDALETLRDLGGPIDFFLIQVLAASREPLGMPRCLRRGGKSAVAQPLRKT